MVILGDTADISHLCEFAWSDWVWFINPTSNDMNNRCLGHYLGPSHDVGQVTCSKILTEKAHIVSCTSIFPLSVEDKNSDLVKQKQHEFEATLTEKLGECAAGIDYVKDQEGASGADTPVYEAYGDDTLGDEPTMPDADEMDHDAFDKYIAAEVVLPKGDSIILGKVL
jgi:hypothetical protein